MQAYEGYVEDGQFISLNGPSLLNGRHRAVLTILDEPEQAAETDLRLRIKWLKE